MRSLVSACLIFAALGAPLSASVAYADGKRDLEDGIAFYENLDTDRALERLGAAAKANDLPAKDRARAFLYLGMVHFENGVRPDAEKAWKSAFELDKNVEVPKGTSPKTIEAIETARASSAKPVEEPPADRPGDRPGDRPRENAASTPETKPSAEKPALVPAGKNAAIVPDPTPPPPVVEESSSTWIWIAAIGTAVVGAAVVGLVVATSGGACEGGGGCVSVSFQ